MKDIRKTISDYLRNELVRTGGGVVLRALPSCCRGGSSHTLSSGVSSWLFLQKVTEEQQKQDLIDGVDVPKQDESKEVAPLCCAR